MVSLCNLFVLDDIYTWTRGQARRPADKYHHYCHPTFYHGDDCRLRRSVSRANYLDTAAQFAWEFASVRAASATPTMACRWTRCIWRRFAIRAATWPLCHQAGRSRHMAAHPCAVHSGVGRGPAQRWAALTPGRLHPDAGGVALQGPRDRPVRRYGRVRELFPNWILTEELRGLDGNSIRCAGGAASADCALHIIRCAKGDALANAAAEKPLGSTVPGAVKRAIAMMERNLVASADCGALPLIRGIASSAELAFRRFCAQNSDELRSCHQSGPGAGSSNPNRPRHVPESPCVRVHQPGPSLTRLSASVSASRPAATGLRAEYHSNSVPSRDTGLNA